MIGRTRFAGWQVWLLSLYLLSLSVYFVVRNEGLWGENDMAVLAELIQVVINAKDIIPPNAYTQGYGYPAFGAALVQLTGLNVIDFQMLLVPLLICWVALPAWLFYRELLQDENGASLATVIFLIQPEVLFVMLRSSHEKFTRGLMFFGLYLLLRGFRSRDSGNRAATFLFLFYFASFALLTFNNLIGFSYVVGIGLCAALLLLIRPIVSTQLTSRFFFRLALIASFLLLLVFVFTFYIYEPSQLSIQLFSSIYERLGTLLLGMVFVAERAETINPYSTINSNWPSVQFYLLVSIANWLLLAISGLLWLSQTIRLLSKRSELTRQNAFLWSLFTAFALLTAGGILVDVTGYLGANLQLRIFPAFSMLAAPMVAKWLRAQAVSQQRYQKLYAGVGVIAIVVIALLSAIKATNEPTVSNYWLFAAQTEIDAVDYAHTYVETGEIWADYSERIDRIHRLTRVGIPTPTDLKFTSRPWQARTFVVSDPVRVRSLQIGEPLPINADDLRVYDNGSAEVYLRRRAVPYEE